MGRIDRDLLIAGPLDLSRPTARYPAFLCIALCVRRGGALIPKLNIMLARSGPARESFLL